MQTYTFVQAKIPFVSHVVIYNEDNDGVSKGDTFVGCVNGPF